MLNTCNRQSSSDYARFVNFLRTEWHRLSTAHAEEDDEDADVDNHADSYEEEEEEDDDDERRPNYVMRALVDRKCMCDMSRLIGFDESACARATAAHASLTLATSSVCRTLEIEATSKWKANQKHLSSVFSVIAADSSVPPAALRSSSCPTYPTHLYSQGSPDLVLELCGYYWNGRRVGLMTKSQRSLIILN